MIKDSKKYHILVIEDNAGDFVIVEDLLTEHLLHPIIVQAETFKQAVNILQNSTEQFDIILLDLTLPDKSGQELLTEMLSIAPSNPLIILTGYADVDFSIKSISQGILDYLLKDNLNSTTLYKSIIYAIERKKNISALKESELRYSNLFFLSPQPMWVVDPETYKFAQVNSATIKLFGYTEEELLQISVLSLMANDQSTQVLDIISKVKITEGETYKKQVTYYSKTHELIEIEVYSKSITINGKIFWLVMGIDVTEKVQSESRISKAIIKAQEDERYEIGGELHDNVCQILASSQISLSMLKSALQPEEMIWFNQCKEYITMASSEIRNLSHRLAPAFYDDTTLEEAIRRLLDTFNADEKHKIVLKFDPALQEYPVKREIALTFYRILQEQLRNIFKHAQAELIEMEILLKDHHLKMIISDNGEGFNPIDIKEGIGISNIKRRTELFSGKFDIISSPGKGCIITIDIPLT